MFCKLCASVHALNHYSPAATARNCEFENLRSFLDVALSSIQALWYLVSVSVTIRLGFPGHVLFFGLCPGVFLKNGCLSGSLAQSAGTFERCLIVCLRVEMKQATDGCSMLMCLQCCYVTTSNSVVNYQDIFSAKFCAQCEYSKTCKPICVICIWFCIVSIDPRLVIFAYLQVCSVLFFDSDNIVTWMQ